MGGFIVQETAIRHPGRMLSMASIMSSTGDRGVGRARPEAMAVLLAPPPPDREGAVVQSIGDMAADRATPRRRNAYPTPR